MKRPDLLPGEDHTLASWYPWLKRAYCKTGLAASRRFMIVHRVDRLHVALSKDDSRLIYGASWLCPGSSTDVVLVADPEPFGGICPCCESAFIGLVVYRCYDADGQLLYVGCTSNLYMRSKGHEKKASWWSQVTRTETVPYPDLAQARFAEAQAIANENPLYNVRGKVRSAA